MNDDERHRLGHNEARVRILRAAARVYNKCGERATVQQIADEADYSTAALYKHFSDRDAILESLWRTVKEEVLEVIQSEPPVELGFVGRLKWLLFEFSEMAEEKEELFLASMASSPSPTRLENLDQSAVEMYERYRETMRSIMSQGLEEGVLDDSRSAELYSLALAGQIQALVERWALAGPFPLRPRMEAMLELFLRGAAPSDVDIDDLDTGVQASNSAVQNTD